MPEVIVSDLMVESFVRNWAPTSPDGRAQFEASLRTLVLQAQREARQPLLDQWPIKSVIPGWA